MTVGGKEVSLNNLSVPLINAVLIGVWLVTTTVTLTYQYWTVKASITELVSEMRQMGSTLHTRMSFIEREMAFQSISRWSRENQDLWCSKTEQANKELNWKCGPLPEPPSSLPVPRVGSGDFWSQGYLKPKKE